MADEQSGLIDKDKTNRCFEYAKDFVNICREMSRHVFSLALLAALVLSIIAIVLAKR